VEGALFIANGKLTSLSEQQLVDCSRSYGPRGCDGGKMEYAFWYIQVNPLETESDYPYKGQDEICHYIESKGFAKVTGYASVTPNSVNQLKAAIAKGPVSVSIEADEAVF
jgi:hypothetical protein